MNVAPRWVVVVSLAVAGTLAGDGLLYAVLPIVWAELGLELWMVGALLSANRLVRLATNPLAGWVMGRVGVRVPLLIAVFASVGTTIAYGLSLGFALFHVARMTWGLCWSFLRLGGMLAALGESNAGSRGYALGFYGGVVSIGSLVAVLFGGVLTDQIGFRPTVYLFAAVAAVGGLALLRERPGHVAHVGVSESSEESARTAAPLLERWWLYGLTFVNGAAGAGLVVATLGLWLVDRFGATVSLGSLVIGAASLNGLVLSFRFAVGTVGSPAAGHLSDRFGRLRFLAITGALLALALAGLSLKAGISWTIAMAILLFLAGMATRVTLDAAAGDLAPLQTRSRAMSWYANASDLGTAVGPYLAYQLVSFVDLAWVYRGAALCLVTAGLLALPGMARARRSAAAQAR